MSAFTMSFLKRLVPLRADISMNLQSLTVENGQPFKGSASLHSNDNFQVQEVRMEIRVTEKYQEQAWEKDANGNMRQVLRNKEDTLYSRDVPVSQSFDMKSGDSKDFPFEVTIPMRMPSRFGGAINYSLKGVANVKGRPDVTKSVNPMIVPAAMPPMAAPGTVVTQVIQREVIKVPCKYCGTLVELTAEVSRCPSCGAPLQLR